MFKRLAKKTLITSQKVEGDQSRVVVSGASAARTSDASHIGRTPWQHRLFGRPLRKDRSPSRALKEHSGRQQRVASSEGPATATAPPPEEEIQQTKKSCWRLFDCCWRKSRVTPVTEGEAQQKIPETHHSSPVKTQVGTQQPDSSMLQVDHVEEFQGLSDEEEAELEEAHKEDEKQASTGPDAPAFVDVIEDALVRVLCQGLAGQQSSSNSTKVSHGGYSEAVQVVTPQRLSGQQVCWLGFPNPAQICYMNSSLQSLLTLAEFLRDVNGQEEVWSLIPEAELMSRFMNIARCRGSENTLFKLQALEMFKRALSVQAPEFVDTLQKDAHEFLTAVLGQMRSLATPLQEVAAFVGKSYSCPVERNLVFKMQNTRTCKRCGARSVREEEFTNLSLDLVPGVSVQQLLQDYQTESELEFRCECGGCTSGQRSTFATLPRVLMLHLKRFSFDQSLQVLKLHEPVALFRELMVTSSQAEGWFSLVSVISHLGHGGNSGHYISDGLHPDDELDAPGDRWLHFNDARVTETTGASVSQQRQQTAYILFYQRRM